jgi:NAD(P)-dependent dehydrogenase (short-subunit alcohol dehydrogenase family)
MDGTSKVVLITGCSSGIGEATALRLVRGGWTVVATARNTASLASLEEAGCRVLPLDVTDEASMVAAVSAIEAEHGAVGVLINNAGYSQSGALETLPLDKVRRQFETNVFGLLRLTQLVLPGMRKQRWGKIVNIGSVGGKITLPGGGAYHATKHAIEALSDVLRFEVAGFGVDVVLIQPGLIKTKFAEAVKRELADVPAEEGDVYARFNAKVEEETLAVYGGGPMARFAGAADDVAAAIERAITARRAPTRVPVTLGAHVLLRARAWMSDRMWDGMLARNLPRPGQA